MTQTNPDDQAKTLTGERADLLETLTTHRQFLRHTVQGLTDEQASRRTTVSELNLAGLIKHVSSTEDGWVDFIKQGPAAMAGGEDWSKHALTFQMLSGESLDGLLAAYEAVARRTDDLVRTVNLDLAHPLPAAPWFTPGATRSARRVFLHIIAETAQHAGHADIIREALDGQKTMG